MDPNFQELLDKLKQIKISTAFLSEKISELKPAKAITVTEDMTVKKVIGILQEADIGAVVVVTADEQVVGIFSERDVLKRVCLSGIDIETAKITSVMTALPEVEKLSNPVAIALRRMVYENFRHLPIVDENGKAVAVISVKDIIKFVHDELVKQLLFAEVS